VDSFVEVFDIGLNKERSSSMGRFTKVTKPHVDLLSSWHMMDVEFRVGSDLTGRGFFGLYTIVDMVSDNIKIAKQLKDNGMKPIDSQNTDDYK
jgi:hypothetical protein